MPKTNIPTSLSTSTQIPVDGKTYKNTLSEITTVTAELAFTYYAGMVITVAQNNKQYIWKQGSVGETPISNSYTYPNGQIVEGYDYSNKTFAFYEYKVDSGSIIPEPDDRVIYIPEVNNFNNYVPINEDENYQNLVYLTEQTNPTSDNYVTKKAFISPIASSSLRVFRTPSNETGTPNITIPVRIETYPNNAALVGDDGEYDTIEEAVDAGETEIVLSPTRPIFNLIRPIANDLVVHLPGNTTIRGPIGGSIFRNSGVRQGLNILPNGRLTLENSLLDASGVGSFNITGTGVLSTSNLTTPLLKTTNIPETVGAALISTTFNVNIEGIEIDTQNVIFGDFGNGSIINIKNTKIDNTSVSRNFIESTNAEINLLNNDIHLEQSGVSSLIVSKENSTINYDNNRAKGEIETLITISDVTTQSPNIIINNSNLESLIVDKLIDSALVLTPTNTKKIKINNTQVKDNNSITNSIDGISVNNTTNEEGTNLKPDGNLQKFINRERALVSLPEYTLFINTNEGDTNRDTWFIDVTISKSSPL